MQHEKERYEKLEMERNCFLDKIHMDTSPTSGIAVDDREDADEGIDRILLKSTFR